MRTAIPLLVTALLSAPHDGSAQNHERVEPVVSADYLALIKNDSLAKKENPALPSSSPTSRPSSSSASSSTLLRIRGPYPFQYAIRAIRERNGRLILRPARTRFLHLSGNYTFTGEVSSVNTRPALQQQYVQGESVNGSLAWQGPETNEVFSYGPRLRDLEYDGAAYPYDINGKLVPVGSGNGRRPAPYDNGLLRTGHLIGQSITLLGSITAKAAPLWHFSIKAGRNAETGIIPENRNTTQDLSMAADQTLRTFTFAAAYSYFSSRFSNDNTNGFLNRVYQDALQTPASFSNAQGIIKSGGLPGGGGQRAYSSQTDNPWFLLRDNGHFADKDQQTGHLSIQKAGPHLKLGANGTLDVIRDNSNQSVKPGAADYPAGLTYTRRQSDRHATTDAYLSWWSNYDGSDLSSTAKLNYILNDEYTTVSYPATNWRYHRTSSDLAFSFNSVAQIDPFDAGLNIGNKFYLSNTSRKNGFFLPGIGGYIANRNLLEYELQIKLAANYSTFYSEPAIDHSYSGWLLTQRMPQDAATFYPTTEASGIDGLSPMEHREFNTWIEVNYSWIATLHADLSIRNTRGQVFPIYENNQLLLSNLADTRYTGFELSLQLNSRNRYGHNPYIRNAISFHAWSDIVTRVQDGYEGHPIAGFTTVYKALVTGRPVGVIMGNDYLRDATNHVVIGPDGFPMVNNQPSVIGDPTPAWVMKFSHTASWRAITIDIDWEYQRGGDIWNGTAAVLDYLGRSAATADQRTITGYVFAGNLQNGNPNKLPVAFYDPASPVGQNRWVRYGYTGVAETYVQKADNIRIDNLSIAYDLPIKRLLQRIRLTAYARNLLLWSAAKGIDPGQLLYDQPGSAGLDFFNLPSSKSYGLSVSFQF